MRTSWRCGCIYALYLLFRFCARLLALPRSHHPPPFCRHNNETASTATALDTINLHKCTHIFVNRIFNCILNGTDVCAQATPLIAFLSVTNCSPEAWHHIPPTENTHCKISSLALWRSAITHSGGILLLAQARPKMPCIYTSGDCRLNCRQKDL